MDDPNIPTTPVDDENCQLLGPTALLVQGVMGVIVLLSLVYKRHREKPKRPWRIWSFDVSKQVAGQLIVHALNVGMSALVSQPESGNNPCTAYFMNVTLDVTLGVGVIWAVLHGTTHLLTERWHFAGFKTGSYGTPPSLRYWAKQTAVYIFSLICMKLVVLFILATIPSLFDAGDWLLSWTGGNEHVQVVFVMGLYPIVMNIMQFWLIDSIVKASASLLESMEVRADLSPGDQQPLVLPDDDASDYSDTDGRLSTPISADLERQKILNSRRTGFDSPMSVHSRSSSVTRSVRSVKDERGRNSKLRPQSLNIHDYPPSRQASPEPSTSAARKSSVPKRSPPPSPSLTTTPNGYGSTLDSPRLRPQAVGDAAQVWGWEESEEVKAKLTSSLTSLTPGSPSKVPPRKESWNMPKLQPPSQPSSSKPDLS